MVKWETVKLTFSFIFYRFNPKTEDEKHSNMVVMEVAMPSGFLVEKDQLTSLLHKPHVKLAHMKRGM